MRTQTFTLKNGGALHIYSNDEVILLQIRRSTPTEEDILQPSVKVAIGLFQEVALAIASELLLAVSRQLKANEQPCEIVSLGVN